MIIINKNNMLMGMVSALMILMICVLSGKTFALEQVADQSHLTVAEQQWITDHPNVKLHVPKLSSLLSPIECMTVSVTNY